jgi:hypothetical protein
MHGSVSHMRATHEMPFCRLFRHLIAWKLQYLLLLTRVTYYTCPEFAVLGAFVKFRKPTISFVVSVRLSAWNNAALTERIVMKFYFCPFLEKSITKIQVSIKSDKTNRYFYLNTNTAVLISP